MLRHWTAAAFALVACTLPCLGSAASSMETVDPAIRGALARQNDAELRALQDRFQRQQFNRLQQQNREQDRRALPQPKLEVPAMKPTCRTETYAGGFRKNCR